MLHPPALSSIPLPHASQAPHPLVRVCAFPLKAIPLPVPPFEQPPDTFSRQIQEAAHRFYEATYGQLGLDSQTVRTLFQQVSQQHAQTPFEQAVQIEFQRQGQPITHPLAALQKECLGSPLLRPFKQSEYQALEDLYLQGQETYRSTANAYRLAGMWRSLKDFATVCKQHPVASTTLIGAVAWSGHRWPFWGGLSGALILAWSLAGVLFHEYRAREFPRMNAQKAEHYLASGENGVGFLITLAGGDGIYKSLVEGIKAFAETPQTLRKASQFTQWGIRLKEAFLSQLPKEQTNWFQKFRFISGLFDNVLMPVNAVAEKFQNPPSL